MSKTAEFPWELLKAECLRTVCGQLMQAEGKSYTGTGGRKEDMIEFLTDVGVRGCK